MRLRAFQLISAAAACVSLVAGPGALAEPAGQVFATDVALADGGALMGQVIDAQGKAVPGAPIVIRSGGQEVAKSFTNDRGVFQANGLNGGMYEVAAGEHRGVYRMWAPNTAPPTASRGIVAVSHGEVVSAQYGMPMQPPLIPPPPQPPMAPARGKPGPLGKSMNWVSNHPLLTAGIVATAIAVPVALSDDDDDPAS